MRKLLKDWKDFVKEVQQTSAAEFPYNIYCDMDGVLVNFVDTVLEKMNREINNPDLSKKEAKAARKAKEALQRDYFIPDDIKMAKDAGSRAARNFMFRLIKGDVEWWANLPWAPGGKELWNYLKRFNPTLLTTPMTNDEGASGEGKYIWARENLGLDRDKVILSDSKFEYATSGGKPNILIDDYLKNTVPFEEYGGIAIFYRTGRPRDAIKILEKLRNGEK